MKNGYNKTVPIERHSFVIWEDKSLIPEKKFLVKQKNSKNGTILTTMEFVKSANTKGNVSIATSAKE